MTREQRTHLFVASVTASALGLALLARETAPAFPGWWAFGCFVVIAFVLETLNNQLRVNARGSTSFIMHIAAGLLFGGFWSGIITGVSTLLGQLARGNQPVKLVFNVSQRIVSVVAATLVYTSLGGHLPPSYLAPGVTLSSDVLQRDLGLFFLFATTYFSVNTVLVSSVVSISSERSFREVWTLNTRGVLGYDIGASLISLLVAWLYSFVQRWVGFGSIGLIGIILPVVAVRHIYGLYYQLQDSGQELLQLMVKAIE